MKYTNEMVNQLVCDIDEITEDSNPVYEVWAIGYDENNAVTDAEMLIKEFSDPDEAVKYAQQLTLADIVHMSAEEDNGVPPTGEVEYISVEVETVITDFEGDSMNVGTVFKKELLIVDTDDCYYEEADDNTTALATVPITTDEYEILEDGTLRVNSKLLENVNVDDYVNFRFVDETPDLFLTYKILAKSVVEFTDTVFYYCDLLI